MQNHRKNLAISLTALLAVLALITALVVQGLAGAQEGAGATATEPDPDSVRFSADFRAAEKPVELVGQYARTSINGRVIDSEYSTEPQPMESSGNACVYGGAGDGCLEADDAASATTAEGTMEELAEQKRLLFIGLSNAGAEVTENFTTGARCFIGENGAPRGEPQRPTGEIAYGGAALLGGLPDESINLNEVDNGQPFTDEAETGVLLNILLALYVDVDIESNWGWDEENLHAYSEISASYRIRDSGGTLSQDSFTARSECGLHTSDGRGSVSPAAMGAGTSAAPRLAGPEDRATTAPGIPRQIGFTAESTLSAEDGSDYHLLSTRELDLPDREAVNEVLDGIRETGDVEGETADARWQLFSAEAAGEQVPVLDITLADGAVVQVRPHLPGVLLPTPDVVATSTRTTALPTTTAEPTTSIPVTTSQQPPEPTPDPPLTTAQPSPKPAPGPTLEPLPATSEDAPDE